MGIAPQPAPSRVKVQGRHRAGLRLCVMSHQVSLITATTAIPKKQE